MKLTQGNLLLSSPLGHTVVVVFIKNQKFTILVMFPKLSKSTNHTKLSNPQKLLKPPEPLSSFKIIYKLKQA